MRPALTKKREPVRTCVGCRCRFPAQVLMRVRFHDDVLALAGDAVGVSGRGAWLCRATLGACLEQAARTGAFDRAFRRKIPQSAIDAFTDRTLDV